MRKLKLFVAACVLFGVTAVQARVDITDKVLNADLSTDPAAADNGWTLGNNWRQDYQKASDADHVNVVEFYAGWGSLEKTAYSMKQSITLPAGYYRLAVNAFYRQGNDGDGTNIGKAWIFAGEKKQNVVGIRQSELWSYSGSNDLWKASNAFKNGQFSNEFDFHLEAETSLEIGFEGIFDEARCWVILGPVKLYEYTAEDYMGDFNTKVPEAEALYEEVMNATVLAELKAAASATFSTVDEVTAGIQALTEAIAAAKVSISNYIEAKAVLDAANNLDASGQASYSGNETIQAIQESYDNRTLEKLTNEQKSAATAAYNTAVKAQTEFAEGSDMSSWIVNPGIDGNTNGWTTVKEGNGYMGGPLKPSNDAMEFWGASTLDENAASKKFNYYQTIKELPNGVYTVSASMLNSTNGEEGATWNSEGQCGLYGKSIAGEEIVLVTTDGETFTEYTTGNIIVADGEITIGVKNIAPLSGRWFAVDNFKLTYVRALTDEDLATVLGPAKETWTAALASANEAYSAHEAAQSFPEGEALNEEIGKSEPSDIDGYSAATTALNEATAAFLAAAPSYETYVAYKAETESLFGTDFNVAAPTTVAEAQTAVQELNVAQYNKVTSDYTYSLSGLIGDFGTWVGTATVNGAAGTPNYLTNEHWSGAPHAYYEQDKNGWGSNAWTIKYEKKCTLPAGEYVIKVAARASGDVSGTISCSASTTTVALPNFGAESKGINKAGEASWSDGEFARDGKGYGWQWRFLPFTLTEKTEVTMTFYAETNVIHNWMSITDGELLSANDVSESVAYDETASNTIEDVDVANVTITREIKEGYNTVVLPFDVTANQVATVFGTGTEVYAFSENSEDAAAVTVNFTKGDGSITANKPVLIKAATASSSQTFDGVQIKAAEAKVAGKNFDFVGTFAPMDAIANGDYFIGEGAVYRSEGATSLNAFRAYIQAKSAGARIVKFFIDGVETTGIEGVVATKVANGKIYNLAGQEVKNAQKGLFIQNGKKIVIK